MSVRSEKRFGLPPDNDGIIHHELALEQNLPNGDPFIINLQNKFEGYTYTAEFEASGLAANKNHVVLYNESGSPYFIRIRKIKIIPNITGNVNAVNATFQARAFSFANTTLSGGNDISNRIRFHDPDFLPIRTTSPTIKFASDATFSQDGSLHYDSTCVTVEESSIPVKEGELLKHDTDASGLHLKDNFGLIIRQGSHGSVGSVNIIIVFTVDKLPAP